MIIDINQDQFLEVEKLCLGVFAPLKTFMNKKDFNTCIDNMRLANGQLFPIPIIFDLNKESAKQFESASNVELHYNFEHVADIRPAEIYTVNKKYACQKIFGTLDLRHPGVSYFLSLNEFFVTGDLTLHKRPQFSFSKYEFTPIETKEEIRQRGWQKTVGFQTRNIPHRAHEYLQKVALEHVDGILIQPLVGFKKSGDFTPQAVIAGYEELIKNYYPDDKVFFTVLSTVMRYAGPREAVFHAIIRKNYGCSDFIIGRDHAGVGDFYDKYAAHKLACEVESELGIRIMNLSGPYYCGVCDGIVTEKTCPHKIISPADCYDISGTDIRNSLINGVDINTKFMRESVVKIIRDIKEPFVK